MISIHCTSDGFLSGLFRYNEDQIGTVDDKPYKDFKVLDFTDDFFFLKVMQVPELANFLKFLIDGKPVDEFTERLMEAVETVKNNKILEVEYMSYYANMHDQYNAGLKAGLFALVKTLKPLLKDFDKVYDAVTGTEEYADITREEVRECYQQCL